MPELTVEVVDAETSRELRRSVLRPSWPVGSKLPGDDADGVVHLAALTGAPDRRQVVSACMVFPEDCPWQPGLAAWRLRGMATDPAYRGCGAGAAILGQARRIAIDAGAHLLWCQARQPAIGFYRKLGWQEFGELFDTDLGPHRRMWCELAADAAG